MEQLIFLAIAILYGIGVGIYRVVKWTNRQLTGTAANSNPIPQAVNTAPQAAASPAVPRQATAEDFRRREQELQAESERAYAYFRQRAEALRTERDGVERDGAERSAPPMTVQKAPPPLSNPVPIAAAQTPLASFRLFQTQDDLIRAFILREALGPPLSRCPKPR